MNTILKYSKNLFSPFILITFIIIMSCNSKKDPLIGETWKLQKSETEIKYNNKYEKIDAISEVGFIFNELTFLNEKEFNFSSKGISDEDNNVVSTLTGGTGFYKTINNEQLILEYFGHRKSLKFKVDSTQLILIEDLEYDPKEPMILKNENSEIKVTEVRNTYFYKK